ncbi:MAG TPA: UDP-3-O-(3-hydroxymyristoyl)glucosamine N-acyltransferase [Rhizomicrobium sp.]|nr:UDP-3-O-(3-hydroxymyristoyl)glucosamine N-acyltransferase [Rhizomicrobium sp.]
MSDKRFFSPDGPFTIADLAEKIGAELIETDRANQLVHDIAELEQAGEDDISVFCNPRLAPQFAQSHAGVIVTSKRLSELPHNGSALLLAADPRLAFAELGRIFYPAGAPAAFIHPKAVIAKSARIGDGSSIAAGVVIGERVSIGPGSRIGANTVIEDGVMIGARAAIGPNCTIRNALIGDGVNICSNVAIGGEGFGFVAGPKGPVRLSHVGRVVIGDKVEIGSNCSIDRGALGDTVIGDMTALDNLVQIGHNVRIGRACVFAGQAGVAGSVTIGDGVMVGGGVSISDHLTIGSGAKIAGKSGVMRDVAQGETVAGYPAVPIRQWHRQSAILAKLAKKECKE